MAHRRIALLTLVLLSSSGCASLAASMAGNALSGDSSVFASDDDPELVRDSIPFSLKAVESLLAASPTDDDLLLTAASGFTQYAYGFILAEGQMLEDTDPVAARQKIARAKRLLARGREYGMRGLEDEQKGFRHLLAADPKSAILLIDDDTENIGFLYWTAAAWLAEISNSKDDMAKVGELPQAAALLERAFELAPDWGDGAIRELLLTYEASRGESLGGSLDKARAHMDRVLELTGGQKIGPYVTWAEVVAVQNQDRQLFDEMLDKVLDFPVDEAPRFRLVNILAQQRARWLKARAGDLFFLED